MKYLLSYTILLVSFFTHAQGKEDYQYFLDKAIGSIYSNPEAGLKLTQDLMMNDKKEDRLFYQHIEAQSYALQGDYVNAAKSVFDKKETLSKDHTAFHQFFLSFCVGDQYQNIGYTFINVNNFGEAEKYFNRSLDYAKKSQAHSLEAYALKGLADLNAQRDNPQKAVELLETVKVKAQNIGDLILSEGIYKGLADNYLILGNFQKHVENNDFYKKTQFQREQNELKSINSFINNSEKKKTEKLNSDNRKHLIINILISVFVFLILSFLLLKIFKTRKKNQALRKQIQELITQ